MNFFWVFLGGGAGSLVRYGLNTILAGWQPKFPLATLLANALACVVLGYISGQPALFSGHRRLLWATGFCGGFSTFSTFTAETWSLLESGAWGVAATNIIGNLLLCFLCFYAGLKLA